MSDSPQIRELYIEELAEVAGGGPVEELLEKLPFTIGGIEIGGIPIYTTQACGEEANSGC